VPASNVPVERVFNHGGIILKPYRELYDISRAIGCYELSLRPKLRSENAGIGVLRNVRMLHTYS